MEKRLLGKTGIEVTEFCFGALPMGPVQKNLDLEVQTSVVETALKLGVNFIDTAEMYRTYEPIRKAMDRTGIRPVIASKSNKKTYAEMENAVNEALEKLGVDYIDIFHLHGAREVGDVFQKFDGALKCLIDMKKKGKVKAIGLSTHSIVAAEKAIDSDAIDVIFPILNKIGRGIIDGTKEQMISTIEKAYDKGKGIYIMKALAGGALIDNYNDAMNFVRSIGKYSSIAVGAVAPSEVEFNVSYFNGAACPDPVKSSKRVIVVGSLCKGCGTCMTACPNSAISFGDNNKAGIDEEKCLTCGYCTPVCPEFAIRVV